MEGRAWPPSEPPEAAEAAAGAEAASPAGQLPAVAAAAAAAALAEEGPEAEVGFGFADFESADFSGPPPVPQRSVSAAAEPFDPFLPLEMASIATGPLSTEDSAAAAEGGIGGGGDADWLGNPFLLGSEPGVLGGATVPGAEGRAGFAAPEPAPGFAVPWTAAAAPEVAGAAAEVAAGGVAAGPDAPDWGEDEFSDFSEAPPTAAAPVGEGAPQEPVDSREVGADGDGAGSPAPSKAEAAVHAIVAKMPDLSFML